MPEGTPYLPFGTVFTSNEWLDQPEGDQDLGEVPGAERTWANGTAPYPVRGETPCGTAEQFARGDARPGNPPLNAYGGLACCPVPAELFVWFGCEAWPGGVWNVYTLVVSGATGPWAPGNGTFTMRFTGPQLYGRECTWASNVPFQFTGQPGPAVWVMEDEVEFTPPFKSLFAWLRGTSFGFWYDLMLWDPLRRFVAPVAFQFGPVSGVAPTVTLIPGFQPSPGFGTCVNLATTAGAYQFATFPVFGTRLQVRPQAGTWPLEQVAACRWEGEILFSPGDVGFPRIAVPMVLVVSPGAIATLTVRLSVRYSLFADLVYASAPGWGGVAPVALAFTSGFSVFVIAPFALTLTVQGA